MLVKQSETAIAVQLCRFLCRFTQLFIYQRKKNTYQYIKVVMISGQMYSPRDLYFAGKIRLHGQKWSAFVVRKMANFLIYRFFQVLSLNLTLSDKIIILDKLYK